MPTSVMPYAFLLLPWAPELLLILLLFKYCRCSMLFAREPFILCSPRAKETSSWCPLARLRERRSQTSQPHLLSQQKTLPTRLPVSRPRNTVVYTV